MNFIHALVLALLLQNPLNPALKPATVSGIVVMSGSNNPLAGAAVELLQSGAPAGSGYTLSTGSDGKFTFRNIPPGEYRLAATYPGYVRGEFGQRGPNSRGLVFNLAAEQEMKDARIAMAGTGAIEGRIFDRSGKPFPYVQVQALRLGYRGVQRVLSPARVAITNDLGEYRLYWLPAGQYAVTAMPLRGSVPDRIINTTGSYSITNSINPPVGAPIVQANEGVVVPVFYPGSVDVGSSATMTVRSGEDLGGIDLTIADFSTRAVRGRLTNLPAAPAPAAPGAAPGPPPVSPRGNVRLQPRNPGSGLALAAAPLESGAAVSDPNTGAFEIRGVLPGAYYLIADFRGRSGSAEVDVGNADVDNVTVPLAEGFEVTARAIIEGRANDGSDPDLARIRLGLRSTAVPRVILGQPVPDRPGVFAIRGVPAGTYNVHVEWSGTGLGYVKSHTMDGAQIVNSVRLDGPPAGIIEVVLGTKFGTISGTAVTAARQPIPGAIVTAVPIRGAYASAVSDAQGNFKLSDLPPGEYRIYAFEDIEPSAWQNAEYMRRYENRGALVRLEEGASETVQVITIPAGQ